MAGGLVIDYYYELKDGYGLQRGYHPEDADPYQQRLHSQCYQDARRIWLENANGMILIRQDGRDVHKKIDPKEMTWIKLLAREL